MCDSGAFNKWLNIKLKSLNTDETIFGSYILGILEGDETTDDKREALEGILSAIIETELENVIKEITDEWEKCQPKTETAATECEDVDAKLARLLETKHLATTVQRQYTEEELRLREQILSQYSQVEYDDEYDEENDDAAGPSASTTHDNKDPLLVKNTNAADVAALAKERREQAKNDSKAKKEKDKLDREKQKQLREEKKEKRKTVKGERRR